MGLRCDRNDAKVEPKGHFKGSMYIFPVWMKKRKGGVREGNSSIEPGLVATLWNEIGLRGSDVGCFHEMEADDGPTRA